ncbi:hypothetical protein AW27_023080 [Streptomyces sp. PCS3-D2]|uniref:hypothetical protein n=1 Tax=Streptomyces sp. PCS3-D2 TaxID=1460244 RepID=UPI0012FE963C|nr:hypothetical protein [Streptomyces sp. PCS3-D2]WKV74129.1 hypothetical protein AW27_023080 [Streptomyces sp. PCS3-D2]
MTDPISVLAVSRDYAISEVQAEVALTWAAVAMALEWEAFALEAGLDPADGEAMSRWNQQFPHVRTTCLDDAVAQVAAAPAPILNPVDQLLHDVRTTPVCRRRPASPLRTNRIRVRIR